MFYFPTVRSNLSISCDANCRAIIEQLSRTSASIMVLHADVHTASFVESNDNNLFHNSFLPACELSISTSNPRQLHIQFHLQASVQIFLWVYMFVAFLMQVAILVMAFKDYSMPFPVALLPITLMLFAAGFSYLGLFIFSHKLIKIINQTANNTPK